MDPNAKDKLKEGQHQESEEAADELGKQLFVEASVQTIEHEL